MLLSETQSMEFTPEEIHEMCQPYFNVHKKPAGVVLRRELPSTVKFPENLKYIYREVRMNRRPKDMEQDLHVAFDSVFERAFGIKYRSQSLFTWPTHLSDIEHDGQSSVIIIPIGKYKMIGSPAVKDLYEWVHEQMYNGVLTDAEADKHGARYEQQHGHKASDAELVAYAMQEDISIFKRLKYVETTDCNQLPDGEYEGMVACQSYVGMLYDSYIELFN